MRAWALLRVGLTVGDLASMAAFYVEALGFARCGDPEPDAVLAGLLGARRIATQRLRRGGQFLELAQFDPPGEPIPPDSRSNDLSFQHVALPTDDIAAAYARLGRHPHAAISRHGPERLPGGIVSYKFRDPEGHPLELIQFPQADPATAGGIDHSAISVADVERSIAFYRDRLGLRLASRQVNAGPAQDAMDGLDGTVVDVVALTPGRAAPHVELLGYRAPRGRPGHLLQPADLAASRLVLSVDDLRGDPGDDPGDPGVPATVASLPDGTSAALIHDPDGHALLLQAARRRASP